MNRQMNTLSPIHRRRWNFAKAFFESMIIKANARGASILFDGELITSNEIVIDDTSIKVVNGRTTHMIFEANPELDHGLFETPGQFEARVRESFVLVVQITY
jgi:hypothetical protein